MKTILIVDDDIDIGNLLEEALRRVGYGTLRAYSGTEALLVLEKQRPDLILLDLMLPGLGGEDALPRMRGVPVIVLSARAGTEDKVALLTLGAEDYITKPFDIREVLARVAARLRAPAAVRDECVCGDIALDAETRTITAPGGQAHLTRTECAVLRLLMQNSGRVITRSRLLDEMGLDTPDGTEASLKTHVSNLRKKLRDIGCPDCIEAVWGICYKFEVS